jgi:hypothetical protein
MAQRRTRGCIAGAPFPERGSHADPSAPDTRASTKAGVDRVVASDVLIANGAHLGAVLRELTPGVPPFRRLEEQALARFSLAPSGCTPRKRWPAHRNRRDRFATCRITRARRLR